MRALFLLAVILSSGAQACATAKIEAAAELMLQINPVLQAERQELAEQSHQRDWSARLSVGYNLGSVDTTVSDGPNAGIQVEIPLFDRARELKLAKARTAFQSKQDRILNSFLGDVEKLCSRNGQVKALEALRGFYRDRLQYRQEQVKEGLEEATVLWEELEKIQQVDHDYRREWDELLTLRLTIARRFGGEAWKQLQALLVDVIR
jgi:hypothetical protein